MLPFTNTIPDAMRLQATMWRYSVPTPMTAGSDEKNPIRAP
jgi:hypothetical protein